MDRAGISVVPNSSRTGPKLENTNLLHSSSAVKFFKLFITDDFVTKMAEHTNFYAVQRGASRSFKPVSDGVISLYLYNFGSNLGVAFEERHSNLWVKRP